MPRRSRNPRTFAQSHGKLRAAISATAHLDLELAQIFSKLALLLLRHGYGFNRVNRLSKAAFVDAANAMHTRASSKPSIARIATVTGLTRTEVSRLLRMKQVPSADVDADLNRATRVAAGWANDNKFTDARKRPRALPFSSAHGGFAQLVRKYSGDIPARAMLKEMIRLGMVRERPSNTLKLIRRVPTLPRSTIDAICAISPWVDVLTELDDMSESSTLTSATKKIRIFFESFPQVLAAVRELEERRRSFVETVENLGTNSRGSGSLELTVSVAVAAAQPTRASRPKT